MVQNKDIDQFLSELTEGYTHIISSPQTIENLRKRGVKFDEPVVKSYEEIVNDLFQKRKGIALDTISKFPSAPTAAIPTIGFLYDEIRECVLFGLNGAAITLSAILVEFSLKHSIVKKKCGDTYDKTEWERIENMELGPVIKEARKLEIIDDGLEKKLDNFRVTVRNPYLHYNIQKLTEDVVARKVRKVNVEALKIEEVDMPAEDNPIVWGIAKRFVDKDLVFKAFYFADSVVKKLFS